MTLRHNPSPMPTARSIVFDTPSGMGGIFTVQIVASDGDRVLVQTIYGRLNSHGAFERWDDCLEFWIARDQLSNERRYGDRTPSKRAAA